MKIISFYIYNENIM